MITCALLQCLIPVCAEAASVSLEITESGPWLKIQAVGGFHSCPLFSDGKVIGYNSYGYVIARQGASDLCRGGGNGGAICEAYVDRAWYHGNSAWTAIADDCDSRDSTLVTYYLDNTPTVYFEEPGDKVREPFNIVGTAVFKPTNSATYYLKLHVNNNVYNQSCGSSTTCTFDSVFIP